MDKVKSIETKNLMIKGNIIEWPGTMIQLSNISCISTADMAFKGIFAGSSGKDDCGVP